MENIRERENRHTITSDAKPSIALSSPNPIRAIDDATWSGPVNATAPKPVSNKAFSKALGRALKRPAIAPVPAFAIQLLYGDMSEIVTKGQNAVPTRTLELGYRHVHPDLDEALRSAEGSD